MLDLHDREWNEFYLRDIFPDIQRGKRLKTADHIQGNIPYVSSSAINNGVDAFIGNDGKVRKFEKCLTLANSGSVGKTFYHSYEFIASDHVTALQSQKLNKYSYLFIATIVQRLEEKYSFNREINDVRINKEKIILPVDESGAPDYAFMEQYIREREQQIVQNYIDYIGENIQIGGAIPALNEKEWRTFTIGSLFSLVSGKGKGANHLQSCKHGISYLGATNRNNAVIDFVEPVSEMIQPGNCIAFIRNGEGSMGYSVYKAESFIATSDITLGYADFLNPYTGFFITTVADKVRGKYNFNYKRSDTRLKKELLQLPINDDGQPDWRYMERYSRQLHNRIRFYYWNFKKQSMI